MEKTFEELAIDESFRMNFGNKEVPMVKVYDVVKLLQQVREATIAECIVQVLTSEQMIDKMYGLSHLPLDRILTEK